MIEINLSPSVVREVAEFISEHGYDKPMYINIDSYGDVKIYKYVE